MKRVGIILGAIILAIGLYVWMSYNNLVTADETVSQQWAQVETVYQRRTDLIPNLVATVKGYAQHEKSTLLEVTRARANVTHLNNNQPYNNPEQLAQFQQAQTQLTSALGRLSVVVERYPDLKANQNFLTLQSQLEGTENRIAVARQRFNTAAQAFNVKIRRFPANVVAGLFHFTPKAYFAADKGAEKAPTVSF
jgi:LemA protein